MDFSSFTSNVISTVIGGILLALIFFFLREKMFAFAELDGSWVFDQTTESSEYNPYVGMTVRFLVLLGRDGNRIYGSAEKVLDRVANGEEREYVGKNRTKAKVTGHIEKRYFSNDRVCVHISENGEIRDSTTFHILECIKNGQLKGRFSSTISNQIGFVKWIKKTS